MSVSGEPGLSYSKVYEGNVRHRRFTPVTNAFRYNMFMWYIDLDEVDALVSRFWFLRKNKRGLVSFFREDFFGDRNKDLKSEVIAEVSTFFENSGRKAPDIRSVRMLSHLRYFNIIFNPVTFYYCFDASEELVAILAEITNTPWGERHAYVLPFVSEAKQQHYCDSGSGYEVSAHRKQKNMAQGKDRTRDMRSEHDVAVFDFDKAFHVSPFNPMNMRYHWVFKAPGERLSVHMDNTVQDHEQTPIKHFDATLGMKSRPLSAVPRILVKQPVMTLKVVAGIYWQALRLWLKRSPFYDHPKLSEAPASKQV
jgi:DUF1365 family protein